MNSKPTDYILALARSFPCLRRKLQHFDPTEPHPLRPDERTFDADRFYAAMAGWSRGEELCGLFVLNVWNPSYARDNGWSFDMFRFVNTADESNLDAFQTWIACPHFP